MINLELSGLSPTQPLLNLKYELENLAKDCLEGKIYNSDFIDLVIYLCSISKVSLLGDIEIFKIINDIESKLVNKDEHLNIEEVESLYYGNNSSLLELLHKLYNKNLSVIPELERESKQYVEDFFNSAFENSETEIFNYNDIDYTTPGHNKIEDILNLVKRQNNNLEIVFEILQNSNEECYTKIPSSNSFKNIKKYLYELNQYFMISETYINPEYTSRCINLISTLLTRYPQITEDFYQKDVYMDLISLCKHPEKAYSKLKSMYSIDETVPLVLQSVYPEIISEVIQDYWAVRDHLTYQQQCRIDRGLGVHSDISNLAIICETYLYKGYNQA